MSAIGRFEEGEINQAQAVSDVFGGNALAALRSVIADAEFLCEQLEAASLYLSCGIVFGWVPRFERGH